MKGENKNKIIENKLILLKEEERENMPRSILRFWQNLQRDLRLQLFAPIDFQAKNSNHNFWYWHLSYPAALIANADLKKAFLSKNKVTANWNKNLEKSIKRKGFFIPQNDIIKLGNTSAEALQNHLVFQQKLHSDFPMEKYLATVQHQKHQLVKQNLPLPIIAIREHFQYYFQFLKEIFQTDFHALKSIRKIVNQPIALADFNEKLPSEQLTIMFYHVVNQYFCNDFDEHFFQKLIDKSSAKIQVFWNKRSRYFFDFFENQFSSKPNKKEFDIFSTGDIEDDFFEICSTDFELIQFQEILDDSSKKNFINFFPKSFKENYGKNRKLSLTQKMKKAIGDNSILERIQLLADQSNPDPKPNFSPLSENWINETELYWYELDEDEKIEFRNVMNDFLDFRQKEQLKTIAQNRWSLHLEKICNNIFAPFILWKKNKENWIPQFNVMPESSSRRLEYQFNKRIENELLEMDLLKKMIKELYAQQSLNEIRNFTNSSHKFKIKFIEKKWNDSVSDHILNIKNRENYRLKRMREFGIVEGEEVVNRRKDIWLNEMLEIEKEIQPYILFVKNAFQGALPVRKTVEFHPFRHSFDGIEFDPETIQDQEKWLNGEVMKSLRIKVDKEPVEQINAFALDSSGSMKHEKMRNLFKLCYLLVLGLEDRKTYDAFHFFSTYFIETANFTHDYTNRNLLFKVLRNISKIKDGKVFYEGKGGTNISAGVMECHQRIQNFIQEKDFNYSGKKYLTSIFVITDGEPSAGILDINLLRDKIIEKRNETNTAIKGIYIKPKGEESMFMEQIFGIGEFVETEDFDNAIERFIQVMTATYKQQRKKLKQSKKKQHGKNS